MLGQRGWERDVEKGVRIAASAGAQISHLEREKFGYVPSASLAYEDGSVFMSGRRMQNGCEATADSLLVFMPHEQTHGACSILKEVGRLSSDGIKARECAVKNVMELIANSLGAAEVAPAKMEREAGSDKPALLNGQ